jgi:LPS sulfotransferase NodH
LRESGTSDGAVLKRILKPFLSKRVRSSLAYRRLWHRLTIAVGAHRGRSQPDKLVFVVATARTGSNLLRDYLNHVPGVHVHGEVLNPQLTRGLRRRFMSKRAVLRHIGHSVRTRNARVGGAKFLFDQLYVHRVSLDDLHRVFPHSAFIILYRRSLAEQFVSQAIAAMTHQWHSRGEKNGFSGFVPIEIDEFRRFANVVRGYYGTALSRPWIREFSILVSYEELAGDPQRLFDQAIFPFLGIPPAGVVTNLHKLNTRPLEEVVANYEEIAHVLTGEEAWLELGTTEARRPESS